VIKRLRIPKQILKDIRETPRRVRQTLQIVCVDHADEVLREALVMERPDEFLKKPSPKPEAPAAEAAAQA